MKNSKEEVLCIENRNKQKIYGILHSPRKHNNIILIIFLNAGLVDRVGPHRLYVKLAREISEKGIFVFRYDSHGLGFSDGELKTGSNILNFIDIEKGLFVNDLIDSLQYLTHQLCPERIYLSGLCGGAVTALLTSNLFDDINGLILLDPPVYIDTYNNIKKNKKIQEENTLSKNITNNVGTNNFIKKFIKNFLRIIFPLYFITIFKRKFRCSNNNYVSDKQINMMFVNSFKFCMMKNLKILMILAENDNVAKEFKSKFYNKFYDKKYNKNCIIKYLKYANHEFHSLNSQQELIRTIKDWLIFNTPDSLH